MSIRLFGGKLDRVQRIHNVIPPFACFEYILAKNVNMQNEQWNDAYTEDYDPNNNIP